MSRCFKNTAIFSIGLAVFIIIAHLAIPHDHDFDSSGCNHKTHHCCHALNILTDDDKHAPLLEFHAAPHSHEFSTFEFVPFGTGESSFACLQVKKIRLKELSEILPIPDFLKISLLRAPPSLV